VQKLTRTLAFSIASAALAVGTLYAPSAASAEEVPTTRDLLDACGTETDECIFHPESETTADAERTVVVADVRNCSTAEQNETRRWTNTHGETNSVGVEVKVEMKFAEVFSAGITTKYGHEWKWEKSTTEESRLTVAPGKVGQLTQVAQAHTVKGTYELHFPDRYYGHYYWYVPFESTTVLDPNAVEYSDRDLTDEERASCESA
jgi:hypothetical protein